MLDGMSIVIIVIVVFATLLAALAIICWTALALFKPRPGGQSEEESRLIQELYNGLQRMEQRVESLETLMLESEHGTRNTHRN